jgi:predicted RNase H-like nuclease (RuvC/YqgF family)
MTEEIKEIFYKLKSDDYYEEHYQQSVYYERDLKKLENHITNLQNEIEKLKETLQADRLMKAFMVEHNRNEKAVENLKRFDIEYLHETYQHDLANEIEFLLNILKGGDE